MHTKLSCNDLHMAQNKIGHLYLFILIYTYLYLRLILTARTPTCGSSQTQELASPLASSNLSLAHSQDQIQPHCGKCCSGDN